MNCIVIDDDVVQQHIICEYINETKGLHLLNKYSSATEAIGYIQNPSLDVIFLDVEMPNMSGIEFLEQIKPESNVILITSNKDYALEAYNNDVVDYLLKPISYPRFLHSISKIVETAKKYLFIKSNGANVKIDCDTILWVESASEYLVIYTNTKKHLIYSSMAAILSKLPSNFMRVHRSNIVNVDKIDSVTSKIVFIGKSNIKVSKTYSKLLKSRFENS